MNERTRLLIDRIYSSYLKGPGSSSTILRDKYVRSPDILLPLFNEYYNENTVIVTGSKGKGSLARMLAALLSCHYSTGLFISPHVSDFRERISVDGELISEEMLCDGLEYIFSKTSQIEKTLSGTQYISPIGITAACALFYFKNKGTRWNVMECGRGARYDDVNRIRHSYCAIGTIFTEHQRQLGDSIEDIAWDKAHAITEDVKIAYIMEQDPRALDVIREYAAGFTAQLRCYGSDFEAFNIRQNYHGLFTDIRVYDQIYENINLSLYGAYQAKHAALAMTFYHDVLNKKTVSHDEKKIREKLENITIPGRMEIVDKKPLVLIDSCINKKSACEVLDTLKQLGEKKVVIIMALPDDKDFRGVAQEVNAAAERIILTRIEHPHYPMEVDQRAALEEIGIDCHFENDFNESFKYAKKFRLPVIILTANTFVHYVRERLKDNDKFE